MTLTREQVAAIKLKAIKLRQKEILKEFNKSSGRGMSSLGEPFKVERKPFKLTQADLIRMQRDAGVRG